MNNQHISGGDNCMINFSKIHPGFYPVVGAFDGLQWIIGVADSEEAAQIKLMEWYDALNIVVVSAALRLDIYRKKQIMAYWPHITYERKTK